MRLLALWCAGSVPLSIFVGRFIRAGGGGGIDHAETRALAALEEMWRR